MEHVDHRHITAIEPPLRLYPSKAEAWEAHQTAHVSNPLAYSDPPVVTRHSTSEGERFAVHKSPRALHENLGRHVSTGKLMAEVAVDEQAASTGTNFAWDFDLARGPHGAAGSEHVTYQDTVRAQAGLLEAVSGEVLLLDNHMEQDTGELPAMPLVPSSALLARCTVVPVTPGEVAGHTELQPRSSPRGTLFVSCRHRANKFSGHGVVRGRHPCRSQATAQLVVMVAISSLLARFMAAPAKDADPRAAADAMMLAACVDPAPYQSEAAHLRLPMCGKAGDASAALTPICCLHQHVAVPRPAPATPEEAEWLQDAAAVCTLSYVSSCPVHVGVGEPAVLPLAYTSHAQETMAAALNAMYAAGYRAASTLALGKFELGYAAFHRRLSAAYQVMVQITRARACQSVWNAAMRFGGRREDAPGPRGTCSALGQDGLAGLALTVAATVLREIARDPMGALPSGTTAPKGLDHATAVRQMRAWHGGAHDLAPNVVAVEYCAVQAPRSYLGLQVPADAPLIVHVDLDSKHCLHRTHKSAGVCLEIRVSRHSGGAVQAQVLCGCWKKAACGPRTRLVLRGPALAAVATAFLECEHLRGAAAPRATVGDGGQTAVLPDIPLFGEVSKATLAGSAAALLAAPLPPCDPHAARDCEQLEQIWEDAQRVSRSVLVTAIRPALTGTGTTWTATLVKTDRLQDEDLEIRPPSFPAWTMDQARLFRAFAEGTGCATPISSSNPGLIYLDSSDCVICFTYFAHPERLAELCGRVLGDTGRRTPGKEPRDSESLASVVPLVQYTTAAELVRLQMHMLTARPFSGGMPRCVFTHAVAPGTTSPSRPPTAVQVREWDAAFQGIYDEAAAAQQAQQRPATCLLTAPICPASTIELGRGLQLCLSTPVAPRPRSLKPSGPRGSTHLLNSACGPSYLATDRVFRELLRSLEQRLVLETRGLRKPAEATPLQRTTMVPDCDNIACSDETLVVHVRAAAALLQHPDALHYPLWQPGAFERHDPQYPATGYLHDGHAPEKRAAFEDACVELRNFRAAQSGDSNAAFRHLLVEDAELLSSQDAVDMLHIVHTTGLVDLTAPGTRVRAVLVAHRVPVPRQMGAPWLLAAMDRALLDTDCAWAGPRYPGVADVDWLRRVLGRTGKDHWIDHRVVLRVVHGPRELCKVWQPASGQRVSAVPVVKKVRVPKKPVAEPPLLLVATRDRHGAHRGLQRTSAPVPMLPYNAELWSATEGLPVYPVELCDHMGTAPPTTAMFAETQLSVHDVVRVLACLQAAPGLPEGAVRKLYVVVPLTAKHADPAVGDQPDTHIVCPPRHTAPREGIIEGIELRFHDQYFGR